VRGPTRATADADQWIGTVEAAESLDVEPREIYRLVDEGTLTAARRGTKLVVDRSDVEALRTSA
jgi:excisionase family DNA binding protein